MAAHPDDEVIGAGAVLPLLRNLVLAHSTDGAPRDMTDAVAHGFSTCRDYAQARRRELADALDAGAVTPRAVLSFGVADQEASLQIESLALHIRAACDYYDVQTVMTHPYEGGHPDHDATCCAVHLACTLGRPFEIAEFTSYHLAAGRFVSQSFLDNSQALAIRLDERAQARKRAMLDSFVTQRQTLAPFGVELERFRPAPSYSFWRPPCPGPLHYELYPWGMDAARFCALAADAWRSAHRKIAA